MPPHRHKTVTTAAVPRKARAPKDYFEFRNVDRAVETALYYGFSPLPAPLAIFKEDRERARALGDDEGSAETAEKIALLRYYLDKKLYDAPQPMLLASELPGTTSSKKGKPRKQFFLDIIGSGKSIAEAILIKTAWAILTEESRTCMSVCINSIGDRESAVRFTRELIAYYRRRIADLTPSCRAALKTNPLSLLSCAHEKCRALSSESPSSIGFLSEGSRAHFKEVLEYLEELNIPYAIDHAIVGNRSLATETVFCICEGEGETREVYATGERYTLGRRLGHRRDLPGVGATIFLERDREKSGTRVRIKKPNFLFLQLGFEAKIKSLEVIELLRLAGIPLYQTVARDKLVQQLAGSEHLKLPYTIIMGQKEALEQTVMVRNNVTRAQEAVKIPELPAYLKRLKV